MRLSDVLSKYPSKSYVQVEGFLQNKKGNVGQCVNISAGKIALNYFCTDCDDLRTFYSRNNFSITFISKRLISLDTVLIYGCGNTVPVWFLVESDGDITSLLPKIRIIKKSEKLINSNKIENLRYSEFKYLLDKAEQAYNEELGAGAIVYLRKVFEKITIQSANAMSIEYNKYDNGNPKNFQQLLEKVDEKCSIIPREFSKDGYKLFRELSGVVHGEYDENLGLEKFEALNRLIIGILENIKNHKEIMDAIEKLQWNTSGGKKNV